MSPTSRAASPPKVGVLLPAAGRGERAGPGELKQFRAIRGVPMLLRSIRPFAQHPAVAAVVVALPTEWARHPPTWLQQVPGVRIVPGGETRAASVCAALTALDAGCSVVLVHDAARPFVSLETITQVITLAASGVGAVAAVPVRDTLKRLDAAGRVSQTVDRRGLWQAQTPQGFPRDAFERAYASAGPAADATDDASLVERTGLLISVVPDRTSNIKITTADDFVLAEALAGP